MNKTMKSILRTVCLALMLCMTVLCFASCGSSTPKADDASGSHGGINWVYTKDGKTLTLTGNGAIGDIVVDGESDAPWAKTRLSVEKLVVGEGITSVGSYAFWGMNNLKDVSLPATLTEIRDFAFAFCGTLESVTLPDSLTALGKGSFEGCGKLNSIFIPTGVTSIGERAFAYCYSLKSAIITGTPAEGAALVGPRAFENCRSLETLVFRTSVTAEQVASDAFLGAAKNFESAEKTETPTGESHVTVHYLKDGNEFKTESAVLAYGDTKTFTAETIEGYTADQLSVTVKGNGTDMERTVTYVKNEPKPEETAPETQAPVDVEEEKKGITPSTIISIVVLVVVLVAIAVGAFFLIRSDKKAAKKGGPVRKNDKKK